MIQPLQLFALSIALDVSRNLQPIETWQGAFWPSPEPTKMVQIEVIVDHDPDHAAAWTTRQCETDLHRLRSSAQPTGLELNIADDRAASNDQIITASVKFGPQDFHIEPASAPKMLEQSAQENMLNDPLAEH